ncbi:MAG: nicotinamide-nucleotide adenylyltransferase [Crenarchaeota archaeon]|nr:nicotinamide-nucleotide adenylyltransferase [Thermoproteota archaeon]MCR8454904.1 nicotinamide-nucleotide adenylyltransferase [Thermoproteota archaeon]
MPRALFVGRFQPFHKGHEHALNQILEHENEVIIAVGTTQENYTFENPLTAGERIDLIWTYLKSEGLCERAIICAVPDINNNYLWPRHVMSLVPKFDVVYSGNNLVLLLFESMNIPVKRIIEVNRSEYQGRVIRQRILEGKPWEQLVPDVVADRLKIVGFEERIRRLAKSHI